MGHGGGRLGGNTLVSAIASTLPKTAPAETAYLEPRHTVRAPAAVAHKADCKSYIAKLKTGEDEGSQE